MTAGLENISQSIVAGTLSGCRRVFLTAACISLFSSIFPFLNQPVVAAPLEPLWVSGVSGGLSARGADLQKFIIGLEDLAARPSAYTLPVQGDVDTQDRRIEAIFLRLARDLALGRDAPRRTQPDLFIPPAPIDLEAALRRVRNGELPSAVLQELGDHGPGYQRLLADYQQLRQQAFDPYWPSISGAPALKPGAEGDDRTKLVADALRRLGYATAASTDIYDESLAKSVSAFQADHGLEPDGVVGPGTASWLSMPPNRKAELLRLNIERMRWFGKMGPEPRVDVNIAAFRMAAYEQGSLIRDIPVIVGTTYRQTPQFESHFSKIVFNPTWTPTPNIVRLSLAPKFKANPGLFNSLGFDVVDPATGQILRDVRRIDWSAYQKTTFPYVLRQRAGPKNALGQIKFDLPNDFSVYLHDTPDRHLFDSRVRSFSSGCIRVSDPKWLASWLLATSESEIERLSSAPNTFSKPVLRHVKVRLLYLTAWRDPEGRLQVRDDLYGRDAALSAALGQSPGVAR